MIALNQAGFMGGIALKHLKLLGGICNSSLKEK